MQSENRRKRYIFDLILVCLLLAISLSVYFLVYNDRDGGAYATVYIGNEVVGEYPLKCDGVYSINGDTNILKIENGEAYMLYADCPDGLCKRQGRVSRISDRITCLPNKVMIMITEGKR